MCGAPPLGFRGRGSWGELAPSLRYLRHGCRPRSAIFPNKVVSKGKSLHSSPKLAITKLFSRMRCFSQIAQLALFSLGIGQGEQIRRQTERKVWTRNGHMKETYGQRRTAQARARRSLSGRRGHHPSSHWDIAHSCRQASRSLRAGWLRSTVRSAMTTHARGTVGTGKRARRQLTFSMAKGTFPSSRKAPVGMKGREVYWEGKATSVRMRSRCREEFVLNLPNESERVRKLAVAEPVDSWRLGSDYCFPLKMDDSSKRGREYD